MTEAPWPVKQIREHRRNSYWPLDCPPSCANEIEYLTFHRSQLLYLQTMWGKNNLIRGKSLRISGRDAVVLLAILAISISVATRTFHFVAFDHPTVQADPSHALRQHLDADAVCLSKPVSNLAVMLLPVAAPHAPPADPQVRSVVLIESLYNRPPPVLSLL